MPTVIAGRVRLSAKEKDAIDDLIGEPINPSTVAEFNAWIDLAAEVRMGDTPEERLLRAMIANLRAEEGEIPKSLWSHSIKNGVVIRF